MTAYLSPVFGSGTQLFNNSGALLVSGKIFVYQAGTTTPIDTWTTSDQSVKNANPIVLDSTGRVVNQIWLQGGNAYKFIVQDPFGNQIGGTWDNIVGINDPSSNQSQWITTGLTPIYINANQFSVAGNYTSIFTVPRRIQAMVTAGTIYGTISASSYALGFTTITVTWDSTALDSGLTQVNVQNIFALSASLSASSGSSLIGDNTGGSLWTTVKGFITYLMSSLGSSIVGFIQAGTSAIVRTVQAKLRETVSAADFGSVGDGVFNNDPIVALILANYPSGGINIVFPPVNPNGGQAVYKFVNGFTVNKDNVHIYFGGTLIDFEPTANGVCITIDKGSTVCYRGSINGAIFFSNDTTHTKEAIRIVDASGYCVDRCGTQYPHWTGAGSIFMHVLGREQGAISNIYAEADKPLVIDPIPAPHFAANIGIDHHNFHNMYLVGVTSTYPVVTMGTGLLLTQVNFTGYQAWIGGSDGLNWVDTTSTAPSNGLIIENVRLEQGADPTKHMINIQHNQALQGFTLRGGQCGDRNGIYLRKVLKPHFEDFSYTSTTLEALNVDTSVDDISGVNCFWQAGSTATLTGHDLVFATPKNPNTGALAPTFFYCLTSNGARMSVGRTTTGTATRTGFTEVPGTGSITSTFRYTQIGNQCFYTVLIVCAGGATIASSSGTSIITCLPATVALDTVVGVRGDTYAPLGTGIVLPSGQLLPPGWAAAANATYVLSGKVETA
jgi:hypothetical protein